MSAQSRVYIRKVLREKLEQGLSEHQATLAALDEVPLEKLKQFAYPAVRNEARMAARRPVKMLEDRAIKRIALAVGSTPGVGTIVSARNELAKQTFALPDGTRVEFARATVEQHLERASWYRRVANTNIERAEMHEAFARQIKKAGVTCLAEIKADAA